MARIGWYENSGAVVNYSPGELPGSAIVEPRWFGTPDGAVTSGLLYRPAKQTSTLVCVMHPRVDCSHHYLVPPLLRAGLAVWAQRSRWVNNDIALVHERVLLDVSTAHAALAAEGFDRQVLVGNSGGASLYCLYAEQAALDAGKRLQDDASGVPLDLSAAMPMPSGIVLLAPHPGQADVLRGSIDPAVIDELDAGASDPRLDMFCRENGFNEPPLPSNYEPEFLSRYRAAQIARIRRIDAVADRMVAEQAAQRKGDKAGMRQARASSYLVVHRTDADPRTTDQGLDPSERAYGSLIGRRPDVTNFGAVGLARISTPQAWVSTWSYDRTRAALRHTVGDIESPTLIVGYHADPCVFPSDVAEIAAALGSPQKEVEWLRGDHYGLLDDGADSSPRLEAGNLIAQWAYSVA